MSLPQLTANLGHNHVTVIYDDVVAKQLLMTRMALQSLLLAHPPNAPALSSRREHSRPYACQPTPYHHPSPPKHLDQGHGLSENLLEVDGALRVLPLVGR